MKANELMIGDWVVYNGDVEYTNPIKIEGMDIATDMLITSDREDVGFKGVEPIPLTAEILEKNGFMKLKANFTPNWYWYVLTQNCFLEDRLKDAFHFNGSNILKFKFVHELQHALKLCGIEKDIQL